MQESWRAGSHRTGRPEKIAAIKNVGLAGVVSGFEDQLRGARRVALAQAGVSLVLPPALGEARLSPTDLGVLETHGTGTALGDPIEVGALWKCLGMWQDLSANVGSSRAAGWAPVRLGAAKTNSGHAEAASGMAGLLRCVLWSQHLIAVREGLCP